MRTLALSCLLLLTAGGAMACSGTDGDNSDVDSAGEDLTDARFKGTFFNSKAAKGDIANVSFDNGKGYREINTCGSSSCNDVQAITYRLSSSPTRGIRFIRFFDKSNTTMLDRFVYDFNGKKLVLHKDGSTVTQTLSLRALGQKGDACEDSDVQTCDFGLTCAPAQRCPDPESQCMTCQLSE